MNTSELNSLITEIESDMDTVSKMSGRYKHHRSKLFYEVNKLWNSLDKGLEIVKQQLTNHTAKK